MHGNNTCNIILATDDTIFHQTSADRTGGRISDTCSRTRGIAHSTVYDGSCSVGNTATQSRCSVHTTVISIAFVNNTGSCIVNSSATITHLCGIVSDTRHYACTLYTTVSCTALNNICIYGNTRSVIFISIGIEKRDLRNTVRNRSIDRVGYNTTHISIAHQAGHSIAVGYTDRSTDSDTAGTVGTPDGTAPHPAVLYGFTGAGNTTGVTNTAQLHIFRQNNTAVAHYSAAKTSDTACRGTPPLTAEHSCASANILRGLSYNTTKVGG